MSLQLQGLASATTFFKQCSRNRYKKWWHPKSKQGNQLSHWLVNRRQLGRVKNACVRPSIAVGSKHAPALLELYLDRMQKRQVERRPTRANLAALRDPEIKQELSDEMAKQMSAWGTAHPEAALGGRGARPRPRWRSGFAGRRAGGRRAGLRPGESH